MEIENLQLANKVKNIAMFTDIHFGVHHNSVEHNEDCIKFINWFLARCKEKDIDTIVFLGDYFEHRNSISVLTQKYAIEALRLLDNSGITTLFLIGNHDLYHRHNRDVHSAEIFKEFKNIHIIEQPVKVDDLLLVPFLFKEEYPLIVNEVNKSKYVFGHFEFSHFYITGSNTKAEDGYHHKLFDGPTHIFSGHYHKRQATDNVIYIGNPFGTSYADAGDYDRGCCFLNCETSEVDFANYEGPSYLKTQLSNLLDGSIIPNRNTRIRCLLDVDLTYSEAQSVKKEMMDLYELREFALESNQQVSKELEDEAMEELDELDLSTLDITVKKLIETGVQATVSINPETLVSIYGEL